MSNTRVMQPTAQAASTPRRMTLSSVTRGRVAKQPKVLLFGVEGIGKTTFGANAPNPIFLDAEEGTAQLDVARLPSPKTWQDVLDAIDELTTAPHDFKTLVIDPLDALEPLCWAHICQRDREKSIESYGYGKGYTAALDEWRVLLAALERLRAARNMGLILVSHSWIKPFKDPESDGYDRYELKLHVKTGGLIKEWSDTVLFAQYETFTNKDKNTKRTRGISSGNRVLRTARTAAYDAKNRYNLPETIPLDYETFAEYVRAHNALSPEMLTAQIEKLLESADEKLQIDVRAAVASANGDTNKLARYRDNLAARLKTNEEQTAQGAQ